ncbi:hypothetical protein AB0M29_21595 [Streptomyces sp. NPDC051976]|uniref:hypothetical protein n=1 Tax=Streptomyces sp. NPDC051976 TaxID=3154947 RepID=UPI00343D0A66
MAAAMETTKPGKGASPVRTLITLGTLTASFVGITGKIRKAKNSTEVIDHVDLIAALTTFAVMAVRTSRARKTTSP